MKKILCTVLISLLIPFVSVQRIFAEDENSDLPFTDVVIDQLVDVSSSVSNSWFKIITKSQYVTDSILVNTVQGDYALLRPYTNHVYFTGSYYDNSIVGLTACNSSSYHYSTGTQTVDSTINIEPGLYGSFNAPSAGSGDGIIYNFGISVNAGNSGTTSTTTSGFDNTTEACRLIGMDQGDGSVDGTTLIELGYEKMDIHYNDGSSRGHNATVYVPGNEDISFEFDQAELINFIDNLVVNFIQNAIYVYHKDYSMYLEAMPGYYVPEYGDLRSRSFIAQIFSKSTDLDDLEVNYTFDPEMSSSGVTVTYRDEFSYNTFTNQEVGQYYANSTRFTWQGTDSPMWYFKGKTKTVAYDLQDPDLGDYLDDNYEILQFSNILTQSWGTVSSNNISENSNLTLGVSYGWGPTFYQYHFYKLQDSGRLGLFNQLGTFLNNWFNRIKGSIDSISGNEDVVQQIENDYNIDFDTSINNYIQNIQNTSQQIDLTAPSVNLPNDNPLPQMAPIVSETIKVFTDNDLWLLIFVPILMGILGLIL